MTHHDENRPGAAPNDNRTGQDAQVERRIARLLRWYPRSWRREHGEVLRADLRDDVARQGRAAVGASVVARAAVHGSAARLTAHTILPAAAIAGTVSAVAYFGAIWSTSVTLGAVSLSAILIAAATMVGGFGLAIAVVSALRSAGRMGDGAAVLILVLTVGWLGLMTAAFASWGAGFDAADRGIAPSGFASAWGLLGFVGGCFGMAIVVTVALSITRASGVRAAWVTALSLLVGLPVVPAVSLGLVFPGTLAVASLGMVVVGVVMGRAPRAGQTLAAEASTGTPERPPQRERPRPLYAVAFLALAALGGGIGVIAAFTGSAWIAGIDSTQAMGRGISIGLFAVTPLCASLAVWFRASSRALSRWVAPLGATSLSFALYGVAYLRAPYSDAMAPFTLASVAVGALAVALWVSPRLPMGAGRARMLGAVCGVVYGATLGAALPLLFVFALPIVATVLGIVMVRAIRRDQGRPVASRRRTESPGRSWARRSRASSVTTAITG